MSDLYQSTNKLADNPYPERSHLLLEGVEDFIGTDFSASGGNYVAQKHVTLTDLVRLGDRIKGFPPTTLEAKVWCNQTYQTGGDIFDFMHPLPYTGNIYSSILMPSVYTGSVTYEVVNTYIVGDGVWSSYVYIVVTIPFNPTALAFKLGVSYKIYNTIYQFTNYLV